MDKVISRIIDEACEKNGVNRQTAELIYSDMFKFIRKTIEDINFENLNSEDDLRNAKVNFNIPRVFKLYTTPSRINYAREQIRKSNSKHDKGVDTCDNLEEESGNGIRTDFA